MATRASIPEVNAALLRIKSAVAQSRYRFVGRRKNRDSLAAAGLLAKHVIQHILTLTYRQYLHGPEAERDPGFEPGEVYVFGCRVANDDFFVKLKLYQETDGEWCACLSFHEVEGPLYYPYGGC